jgi:plastocyanin
MRLTRYSTICAMALVAAACSSSTSPSNGGGTGGHSLTIDANTNLTFRPTPDTVAAGSAVNFAWHAVAHNVQFDTQGSPANVGSGTTGFTSGDSSRVFPTAGTYSYHCGIHGLSMSGVIVVQ